MKDLTAKNIFILLAAIYLIIWAERINKSVADKTEIVLEHERNEIKDAQTIGKLNLKVNFYANQIQQTPEIVGGLTNNELDSLFAAFNP